jgi:hypothetical protein
MSVRTRHPTRRAAFALLAALVGCGFGAEAVTVRDVVEDADRLAEKPLVLVGRVEELRLRTPSAGNTYTSFVLADGTGRVPAIAHGTLDVNPGDLVEVRGVFRPTLSVGSDTLVDTIEAAYVRRVQAAPPLAGPAGPP